jgi:hypothetical protein
MHQSQRKSESFPSFAEKRRHPRLPVSGAAMVVKANACLGRFWMVNLSVGGALIAGEPPLALGERVALRLELGAQQAVSVEATVVRVGKGPPNPTVGFAFHYDSVESEHAMTKALAGIVTAEVPVHPARG